MTWEEAKEKIEDRNNIGVGTDLNTKKSKKLNYRYVRAAPPLGFRVQIGKRKKRDVIDITWDMLEKCWRELNRTGRWDSNAYNKVFEEFFPKKMSHPCHNHVIGKIFEKAGLVDSVDDKFYVLK